MPNFTNNKKVNQIKYADIPFKTLHQFHIIFKKLFHFFFFKNFICNIK